MTRYAVIRDYEDEQQVTFNERKTMFQENQMHVEQVPGGGPEAETKTVEKLERKYKIVVEYREAKSKTHFGWFVNKCGIRRHEE